jgi:hypothetical protein
MIGICHEAAKIMTDTNLQDAIDVYCVISDTVGVWCERMEIENCI